MQIIQWQEFLQRPLGGSPSAVTVGVFDGVHRGHKALIECVAAHKDRAAPMVVTFRQGHYKKSGKQDYPGDILSFRQKMSAFDRLGVSLTVVIEFSESFRRMSGMDFFRTLHERANMSFLAVGSNFRCGYRMDTDAAVIQDFGAQHGIPVSIVPVLTEASVQISSSQIRAAIARGDLSAAAAMLGYPFTVDLAGQDISSPCGTVFGVSRRASILPPPGTYSVYLVGEKNGQEAKTSGKILVEDGNIIIDKYLAEEIRPEYVEFCL